MARLSRLFLTLAACLSLWGSAQAEGLVQLTLKGKLDVRGGAPVEILWGVKTAANVDAREASLRLHLADGTTAQDLASLLVARLREQKIAVTFPAQGSQGQNTAQIFVESTILLSLRLAPGFASAITTCDAAPSRVRFIKCLGSVANARATINTSTYHAHTRKPGSVLLDIDLVPQKSPAQVSELLFELGLARALIGDRPSADSWRPVRGEDGAAVTGCSIELHSAKSDWGLEVTLTEPVQH